MGRQWKNVERRLESFRKELSRCTLLFSLLYRKQNQARKKTIQKKKILEDLSMWFVYAHLVPDYRKLGRSNNTILTLQPVWAVTSGNPSCDLILSQCSSHQQYK